MIRHLSPQSAFEQLQPRFLLIGPVRLVQGQVQRIMTRLQFARLEIDGNVFS